MKSRTVLTTLLSLILLVAIPATAAWAKSSVTVLDLRAKGVDADMTAAISMSIRDRLEENGYEVPSREDMMDTLDEETRDKLDEGNCKSLSCFAETGGAMGTDLVLAGSVTKLRKSVVVKLVLVDPLDEEVMNKARTRIKSRDEDEITEEISALALSVVKGKKAEKFESDDEDLLGGAEDEDEEDAEEEDDENTRAAVAAASEDEEDNFVTQEPPKPATFFTYAKWTGLGVTLALGGVTGFTGYWAKKRQDDYNNTYAERRDFDFDAKADAENYALTTNILIGVTSAAAAATITFFILDALDIGRDTGDDDDESADSLLINPWVGPNAAGASVFMRF